MRSLKVIARQKFYDAMGGTLPATWRRGEIRTLMTFDPQLDVGGPVIMIQ